MREPVIHGHVGHDPRPVDESRLGGDKEERPFGKDRDDGQRTADGPAAEEIPGQNGVQGLSGDRAHSDQEIAQENPPGREGQGGGHVDHRLLPGLDSRLAQDLEAIGNRLDPGVRPAAEREGFEEEQNHASGAERHEPGLEIAADLPADRADLGDVGKNPVADEQQMGHDERQEDRRQERDRLLHPAEVEDDEEENAGTSKGTLAGCQERGRKLKIASPQDTIETVIVNI